MLPGHSHGSVLTARCAHCPLNSLPDAQDVVCVAIQRNHPPYCWAMDPTHPQRNPAFQEVIVNKSLGKPTAKTGCSSCQQSAQRMPAPVINHRVAVVVISHNYGRYLTEALDSVLQQTHAAAEVLVVDDASSDNTADVARSYQDRGVKYLRVEHRHVHKAREAGFLATTSPVLCFLDADDVLEPDYLIRGLSFFSTPEIGIVYSDVQTFGDQRGRINYPLFDRSRLDCQNYMHAGSLVRREALTRSNAFNEPPPNQPYADWYLWRKIVAAGFSAAKSPAIYRYRRHGQAMLLNTSLTYRKRAEIDREIVTIFTPLSGRVWAWKAYWRWLKTQAWPRAQVRLVLADTSQNDRFHRLVRKSVFQLGYQDVRIYKQNVGSSGLADEVRITHQDAVRSAVKRIYARFASDLNTPYALVVEDDVLPTTDVISQLFDGMDHDVAAIGAPYPSRFINGTVSWGLDNRIPAAKAAGIGEVGGTGFGCTLLRRAVLATESFTAQPGDTGDYDVDFSKRVRQRGWKWRMHWDCPAEHRTPTSKPCAAPVVSSVGPEPTVSVIIAAHNNGAFLRDAIESARNQSQPPLEILYSDDASTDNSLKIAAEFPDVRVLPGDRQGACNTRNHAVSAARGNYLLHLDGDDILPQNYLAQRLAVVKANPDAAFVYGAAQAFGGSWNYYWEAPEWSAERLWSGNYVNTSTLIRRDAFENVGRWRETIGTAWDWDLALRLAKAGYRGVHDPRAFLLYRHHAESHSQLAGFKEHTTGREAIRMKSLVRTLHCSLKIAAVISGRLPQLFESWLERLVANVRYRRETLARETLYSPWGRLDIPAPNLEVLYTGPAAHFDQIQQALHAAEEFDAVSVTHAEWRNSATTEAARRSAVATFLANSYNQLLSEEQMVWLVEDDVLPPEFALHRLSQALLQADYPRYAVSGLYRNRHVPEQFVAHRWDGKNPATIQTLTHAPQQPEFFDMAGTGCLLIFRPFARHSFASHYQDIPAHDWRWCLDLKQYKQPWHPAEKQVLVLPDVLCQHYQTESRWV